MENRKITFVGAGNMAEAMVKGMLASGITHPDRVTVTDVSAERLEYMKSTYGVHTAEDNASAVDAADMVILAVKPQVLPEVLKAFASHLRDESVLVSIAAGVAASSLYQWSGGRGHVIRVMPNTPCLVGAGASAVSAGPGATEEDLQWTEELLRAVGIVERVPEEQMDGVTALSGSGPAYLFYVIEAMTEAAESLGLDSVQAGNLACQTVLGAGMLAARSDISPAELRRRVTSPGGTTEAALGVLEDQHVKQSIIDAMKRAAERSHELSKA